MSLKLIKQVHVWATDDGGRALKIIATFEGEIAEERAKAFAQGWEARGRYLSDAAVARSQILDPFAVMIGESYGDKPRPPASEPGTACT